MRYPSRSTGFTLLELLIAMSLLSFILVLLFSGLRLGSRAWDAGEAQARSSTHMALLSGFLRKQLAGVLPYKWHADAAEELAFSGHFDRLEMVTPTVAFHDPGGLYLVSLELQSADDQNQLVMTRVIPDSEIDDFSVLHAAPVTVLAEGVETLRFSYYGADTRDGKPLWQDNWEGMDWLPYLIRIEIEFSNGKAWPALVVAPRIGAGTGCAWDIRQDQCSGGPG